MSSSRSPITCHVLDTSLGKPAKNVQVTLQALVSEPSVPPDKFLHSPLQLAKGSTDSDGRCTNLLNSETVIEAGVYKMTFQTQAYFNATGRTCFYPLVDITFNLTKPSEHYHIPLLISPYSYTTYRGS